MELSYSHLLYIIRAFYFFASTTVILCTAVPFLRTTLIPYGKALVPPSTSNRQNHNNPYISLLRDTLSVPKKWFTHFYALGLPWSLYLLYECLLPTLMSTKGPLLTFLSSFFSADSSVTHQIPFEVILAQTMMLIQMSRRLYECLAVSKHSNARMHLAHYLAGLLFYFFTPVAVGVEGWINMGRESFERDYIVESMRVRHLVGIAMFLWASYEQHRAHRYLASLRPLAKEKPTYILPAGSYFSLIACPHYLFEVIIYFSFVVLTGGNVTCWFLLTWVLVDLSVAADQQWRWYKERFGTNVPREWKRIIPFLF